MIKITNSNIKMGAIPSFSLPSGVTCSKEACATCYLHGCYARKIERLRPNVLAAYQHNYQECLNDLPFVEQQLMHYFAEPNAPRLFRIHAHGDFYSVGYFDMWLRVIRANPQVKFLAFTKQYHMIHHALNDLPENLRLVWSAWPGVPVPPDIREKLTIAWMQDGTETRVPETAHHCSGKCQDCNAQCWSNLKDDVVFHKH